MHNLRAPVDSSFPSIERQDARNARNRSNNSRRNNTTTLTVPVYVKYGFMHSHTCLLLRPFNLTTPPVRARQLLESERMRHELEEELRVLRAKHKRCKSLRFTCTMTHFHAVVRNVSALLSRARGTQSPFIPSMNVETVRIERSTSPMGFDKPTTTNEVHNTNAHTITASCHYAVAIF